MQNSLRIFLHNAYFSDVLWRNGQVTKLGSIDGGIRITALQMRSCIFWMYINTWNIILRKEHREYLSLHWECSHYLSSTFLLYLIFVYLGSSLIILEIFLTWSTECKSRALLFEVILLPNYGTVGSLEVDLQEFVFVRIFLGERRKDRSRKVQRLWKGRSMESIEGIDLYEPWPQDFYLNYKKKRAARISSF